MELNFPVSQCPSLDSLYCRTLELTFSQSLGELQQSLHPLMLDLKNKQLAKCYLIPLESAIPKPKYEGVLLGGTFDYFHIGHQLLLLTAIFQAEKRILIGVSGQNLLAKKKNKQLMQPIEIRMKEIEKYIKKIKPHLKIEIQQINDPFGPAIVRDDFQAIAVSIETRAGADKINEIRKQRNLKELIVQMCPLMSEGNKVEVKVSSSQSREYILRKNKMSVEEFIKYKQKWIDLNIALSNYFKIEHSLAYTHLWWDRLLHQYSEYWRFYHTNSHILSLLQEFQHISHTLPNLSQLQLLALQVSVWFHDAEYAPPATNNEELSAELANKFLKGLFNSSHENLQMTQLLKMTQGSIISTKTHQAKGVVEKVLTDLDMSIFDSDHEKYIQYAEGIRGEYVPVVKNLYNQKRMKFLQSLRIEEIFYYRKHTNVRANIQWEMGMLSKKQQL